MREAGIAPCRHVRSIAETKVAAIDARIAALWALREDLTRLAERAGAVEDACVGGSSICLAVEDTPAPTP